MDNFQMNIQDWLIETKKEEAKEEKHNYLPELKKLVGKVQGKEQIDKFFEALTDLFQRINGNKPVLIMAAKRRSLQAPFTVSSGTAFRLNDDHNAKGKIIFCPSASLHTPKYEANLVYIAPDRSVNLVPIIIKLTKPASTWFYGYFDAGVSLKVETVEVGKITSAKLMSEKEATFLNSPDECASFIGPYAEQYAKSENLPITRFVLAPEMEQLGKAGFWFAKKSHYEDKEIAAYNRLCRHGNSIKEIFKTPKSVWSVLKTCPDLTIWDLYRKMEKQGKMSVQDIRRAYDAGYREMELNAINSILNKEYEGKRVFSWESLQTYLNRVDMFEAIDFKEATQLLSDYLNMCSQIHVKPNITGDSLKREHDVTARTLRNKRNEIMAEKMDNVCGTMAKYNYSEDVFEIRAVKDYDDLIDEAKQQHNCVASYANSIANGTSYIYVMRTKQAPGLSLITVELEPTTKRIRQKFLAYNRPIHNKAQSEFLDRWVKHVKEIA